MKSKPNRKFNNVPFGPCSQISALLRPVFGIGHYAVSFGPLSDANFSSSVGLLTYYLLNTRHDSTSIRKKLEPMGPSFHVLSPGEGFETVRLYESSIVVSTTTTLGSDICSIERVASKPIMECGTAPYKEYGLVRTLHVDLLESHGRCRMPAPPRVAVPTKHHERENNIALSVSTRFHGVLTCIVRYAHFLTSTSPSKALLESADSKGPTFNSKTSTPPVHPQLSSPDFQHLAAPVRLASSSLQRFRSRPLDHRLCVFAGLLCVVGLRLHAVRVPARY